MARQKHDSAGGDAVLFERLIHFREADWPADPDAPSVSPAERWGAARKAWSARCSTIDEVRKLWPADLALPPTPDPREELCAFCVRIAGSGIQCAHGKRKRPI